MAVKPDEQLKLKDILECPACTEVYDDPRSLPCVHTFCMKCMEKYTGNKTPGSLVPCPVCRMEFTLPESGITGLPKNIFVENLLHLKSRGLQHLCEVCCSSDESSNAKALATKYCVDCQERLCDSCAEHHKKYKVSRYHRQISFDERDSNMKNRSAACEKHQGEQLKLYCLECKLPLCLLCHVEAHHTHKCSDFNDLSDKLRHQMTADANRLEEGLRKCGELLKGLDADKQRLSDQATRTALAICDRANHLHAETERQKVKLLNELSLNIQGRNKTVDGVRKEIEMRLTLLEGLKTYTEELASKGTPCDVARETEVLRNRTEELLNLDAIHRTLNDVGSIEIQLTPSVLSDGNNGNIVGKVECRSIVKGWCSHIGRNIGVLLCSTNLVYAFALFLRICLYNHIISVTDSSRSVPVNNIIRNVMRRSLVRLSTIIHRVLCELSL